MPVRTRFAPSPTGRLHLGHALAAKVARDLAVAHGGEFLLRFEDIDGPRVRDEFYQGILDDLEWLGLHWSGEPLRQTCRSGAYAESLANLKSMGMVYPCFCTRREIESIAAAPQGPEGPVYPGTCRQLSETGRRERIDAGAAHSWRLDSANAARVAPGITFTDQRFGTIAAAPGLLGDVVLARKDIGTAYHLAVVVDDAFQEITHVTRGEDLLSSTHVHRLLQELLGLPAPVYHHHPLVLDENGRRLAKRCDSLAIASMRESGMTPDDVWAALDARLSVFPQ
jgi:glutamyl-Q tRNA(Asp) synthetase